MTKDTGVTNTREAILIALRTRGTLSIDETVAEVGRSKTAVRVQLLRLEGDGDIARVKLSSDGPGRPPVGFKLTNRGARRFPTSNDAVLTRLLRYVEENGGDELLNGFFQELWDDRMADLLGYLESDDLDSASLDERLSALEATLDESGFMPLVEESTDADGNRRVCVKECNCPIPAVARATGIPCRLEVEFLSMVLGGDPTSVSISTAHSEPCLLEFHVPSAVES